MGPFWVKMASLTGMSAATGALPQLRAATDPAAKSGQMYAPRFGKNGAAVSRPIMRRGNEEDIARLWEISEQETGVALEFDTAVDSA